MATPDWSKPDVRKLLDDTIRDYARGYRWEWQWSPRGYRVERVPMVWGLDMGGVEAGIRLYSISGNVFHRVMHDPLSVSMDPEVHRQIVYRLPYHRPFVLCAALLLLVLGLASCSPLPPRGGGGGPVRW